MLVGNVAIPGVTVEQHDVNVRINILPQASGDAQINVMRQTVNLLNGQPYQGAPVGSYNVTRKLSAIANDTVTLPATQGGLVITAAQMAAALEMFTDKYATADKAAAAAAAAPAATPPSGS